MRFPAWFLGMNEVMTGSRDLVFLALAHRAELSLGLVGLVARLSYTVAYRRHVRRTLESTEGGDSTRTAMHERIGRIADRIAPDSVERGMLAFIGKTMARSAKHRIFLRRMRASDSRWRRRCCRRRRITTTGCRFRWCLDFFF